MVESGKFCKYDHGERENEKIYGQVKSCFFVVYNTYLPIQYLPTHRNNASPYFTVMIRVSLMFVRHSSAYFVCLQNKQSQSLQKSVLVFQKNPPLYDVSKMKTPVSLYWGDNDWLADPTDIEDNLLPYLQNVQGNFKLQQTNHLDFIWGLRVIDDVYKPIIADMSAKEL